MKLNEQIREHRKKAGFTQEQVAKCLGVSTPAVNKWESGATYPDITLLVPLARLLKMDMNTLFAFHENLSGEEIRRFCNEIESVADDQGLQAGFSAAIEKLREYPNCDLLRYCLALLLEAKLATLSAGDRADYEQQLIGWYEQVAGGRDEEAREAAVSMLASKHLACGNVEKAQELIDLLPEQRSGNKQMLKINVLLKREKYAEAAALTERKLYGELLAVQSDLAKLVDIDLLVHETDAAAEIAGLSRKMTELFGLWEYNGYVCLLQTALALRDVPQCLALVEAMLDAAMKPVKAPPMFCHLPEKPIEKNFSAQVIALILHQFETDGECAFLRADADFRDLIARYRKQFPCESSFSSDRSGRGH